MRWINNKKKNIVTILLSIFLIALLNYFYPLIRFENKALNVLFMIPILLIPTFITLLGFYLDNGYRKVIIIMVGVVISFISILFLLSAIADLDSVIKTGNYATSEQIKYNRTQHYKLSTYKIEGNKFAPDKLVIRQEKELVNGILLVRVIFKEDNRESVTYELDNNLLTIDTERYLLKNNLYFR